MSDGGRALMAGSVPPTSGASDDKGSQGLRVHRDWSHQPAEYFIVGRGRKGGTAEARTTGGQRTQAWRLLIQETQ